MLLVQFPWVDCVFICLQLCRNVGVRLLACVQAFSPYYKHSEMFVKGLAMKQRMVNCMGYVKFRGENKITCSSGGEDNHFEYLRLSGNII